MELAVLAESLGADSLWVSHHVIHTGFVAERLGTGNYYDPFVSLAAAAVATTRPRLGTSVLVLGYLNPFVAAKQLATIDWLSHGRVDVGVGVGALHAEFAATNVVAYERRGDYADEFVEVMKLLWGGGRHTHRGEFFHFDDVEAYPGPYEHGGLPILVGGNGSAATRRLVRLGDGWHGLGLDPGAAAGRVRALTDALSRSGRSTEGFPMQVRLHIDAEDLDTAAWKARAVAYAEAGLTDLVLAPQTRDKESHRRWLHTLLPVLTSTA
jgi:probable F420-dependent oxidoreductase